MTIRSSRDAETERRLLELAYRNLPSMLGVSLLASLGATIVLANHGNDWVWGWLAVGALISLARQAGWMCYRAGGAASLSTAASLRKWRRAFAVGLVASGCVWAFACVAVAFDAALPRYTLIIIASALAGGATGIVAAVLPEGRLYVALLLLPASIAMLFGDPETLVLGLLGFAFCAAMQSVLGNNHAISRHSISLEIENGALMEDLKRLNAGLETMVAERTQALAQLASRDALTSLPNRRGLMDWMQDRLGEGEEAAILFLDLDRFKQINDAMGHEIGDQVLRATAARLAQRTPENAMLARWGGDEFVMVIAGGAGLRQRARSIAASLVEAVDYPFEAEGQNLSLGLSVGVAFYPADARTHQDAILAADVAVAEVKRQGRGHVLAYSEPYGETQRRRFDLGRALGEAIKAGDFTLHYQPIVNARTGRVISLEALARWRHAELGDIRPDEFIRLAEETDRIVALGDWVLQRACADAATWASPDGAPRVAANISVKQLLSDGFPVRVMQILTQAGLPAGRLELEVTESLFDDAHIDRMLEAVAALRAIGVSVHIDDFGVGYSSLSRLQSFPVSAIKIDRSFVAQLDGHGRVIVESAVMIARRFGMAVTAEGIETAEQAEAMRELGVDYMQGYYFGRPAAEPRLTVDWTRKAA
jgi:diguanylate cyclase (GGDEF)-like protein